MGVGEFKSYFICLSVSYVQDYCCSKEIRNLLELFLRKILHQIRSSQHIRGSHQNHSSQQNQEHLMLQPTSVTAKVPERSEMVPIKMIFNKQEKRSHSMWIKQLLWNLCFEGPGFNPTSSTIIFVEFACLMTRVQQENEGKVQKAQSAESARCLKRLDLPV